MDRRRAEPLTPKRQEILAYIKMRVKNDYPPSLREIAQACELNSPSSAKHHLQVLARHGIIEVDGNKPRAIKVR